jgi:hypothetical protein
VKETIRFSTNVPAVVALAFDEGKDVEGRYGDQVMYSLQGERVMYVPPIVREKMVALGIRRNDPIRITKAEARDGNRKGIQWLVERVQPEEFVPAPAPPQVVRPAGEAAQEGIYTPGSNGSSAGNGNGARPIPPSVPFVGTGAGGWLLSALVNTIDICEAAQKYAHAKNFEIRFEAADVRALAITAFIQHSREGGGR